ncbi:MAG: hypothetical protein ACYC77_08045 [Coriobacteriia bacterium]
MAVRRISLLVVVAAVAAIVLLTPGMAFANYAIHGSYTMDTDACAGCHRAHTAASPIQWTDTNGGVGGSALLLGTAATIDEFCNTCHGTASSGADTNVVDGIFDADDGDNTGVDRVLNAAGEKLNGGGFNTDPMGADIFWTQHAPDGSTWTAWGGGATGSDGLLSIGGQEDVAVSCSVCHDVHGSANYRLLKHVVNGQVVGNYTGDPVNPTPVPWVISAEIGYPTGGWLLHEPGASQVVTYQPDYTTPRYAKAPGGVATRGISAWCSACHQQYMTTVGTTLGAGVAYDAADGFGSVVRHRHPVNVPMSDFAANLHPGQLLLVQGDVGAGNPLPLAHDSAADWTADDTANLNDASDWLDCLTCHVAHGASTLMTGFAAVENNLDPQPNTGFEDINGDLIPDVGAGGVAPSYSNALLRYNNRTVCEVCHNK